MKKYLQKTLISAAVALAIAPGFAGATSWTINYTDANATAGTGITLNNPVSAVTDEYKYTAESLVLFHDLDASGGISAGDTFDDVISYRIDALNFGGNSAFDADYIGQNVQISGTLKASGIQVDAQNYLVTSAAITFYFDGPADGIFGTGTGTMADFGALGTFVDGLLVQTGQGAGAGTNAAFIPDGAIDINFVLTDLLAGLATGNDPFELFDPFIDLDKIRFLTDSNNNACDDSGGGAVCGSTIAALATFFGINTADYDFLFHTRSDGSATKVPEPASIALLGLGLLGAGYARRKTKK
jgi:PEP-CTERM motif-containing protein